MMPYLSRTIPSSELESVRAVIYARQSKRRTDESEASTESQVARATALAEGKGWAVGEVFQDVGKSGWDPEAQRDGFEAMMKAVRAGEVDVVIVFTLSRLTRRGAMEAMRINDELTRYGVRLVSVEEPFLDTTHPIGVAVFALIAALAQQESELKSAFISEAKAELKAAGGHVSGRPPFGMKGERVQEGKLVRTRLIPDPETAPTVLGIVAKVMDGRSVSAVVQEMNEEGVPSPGALSLAAGRKRPGKTRSNITPRDLDCPPLWDVGTLNNLLKHPALGGFAAEWVTDADGRRRRRQVVRRKDGSPMHVHVGIMEPSQWYALQDVLKGRSRESIRPRNPENDRTLLGGWGVLRCGVCSANMVYEQAQDRYTCPRPTSRQNSHGLAIKAEVADSAAARLVWTRLGALDFESPEDREWLAEAAMRFARQRDLSGLEEERSEAQAQLDHVLESMKELYADRADGLYRGAVGRQAFRDTLSKYQANESACRSRLEAIDAETSRTVEIPSEWLAVDGEADPLGEGSVWAAWDMVKRREFLSFFVDRFEVIRAERRGRIADPAGRVMPDWAKRRELESAAEAEPVDVEA
ncbi:recombinase family protein [Streptacidiphilus anmyonensis]|uniref:recombinase family protein n=1 Tax=Streptacidiphilus anmyonensis TaxID=405782 RepID=UPI0007C76206|nr:recombinase family protein [Streptacidiphilus anmyonensis]